MNVALKEILTILWGILISTLHHDIQRKKMETEKNSAQWLIEFLVKERCI